MNFQFFHQRRIRSWRTIFKKFFPHAPLLLVGFLLITFYLLLFTSASAQNSPDAIAFRVISNPKHHSPARWYDENIKIKGAPSEVLVDGYRAVRDGRTVYVGAANYDSGTIYTNIYLISYNQAAETATVDIFGQMLAHWRFNTNLEIPGDCKASSTLACINDRECPTGDYCTSLKGEVVRNTRRLADIADIETLLNNYKNKKGKFPTIDAGSYRAQKTLSVWPSWQETLGKDLGSILPIDPVNRLGSCPANFNPTTCWDELTSSFAGTLPDDLSATSTLPIGSEVYVYRATADGLAYTLSTTSVDPATIIGGGEELTDIIGNKPPRIEVPPGSTVVEGGITYINIIAYADKPFEYLVRADDPDSNLGSLSQWTISLVNPSDNASWVSNLWSAAPVVATTTDDNVKRFRADVAGQDGFYYFDLTVSDGPGGGGSDTKHYRVTITNQPPIITITPAVVSVVVGRNDLITKPIIIKAIDPEANYPLTVSPAIGAWNLPAGLVAAKIDEQTWRITGIPIYAASTFTTNGTLIFTDSLGASAGKNYSIEVINQPPVFTSAPGTTVRVNFLYTYDANATDADGHLVRYQFATGGQPAGFTINTSSGLVSGTPATSGNYNIIIEAYDGYGATTTQGFNLTATSYCGDGSVQTPNDEGKTEQCDDSNTINNDACANNCDWSCESIFGTPYINLGTGLTDSIITDDNSNPNDSVTAPGNYLKLAKVMPTPYLWVANTSMGGTWVGGSYLGGAPGVIISKIRTFDGYRKTVDGLDISTMEYRGQVIGNYPLTLGPLTVSDPSRTAVNAETGEVWVVGRASGTLAKLDIDGNVKKICPTTGSMARGVAIEENGDVWVANHTEGTLVKFSGDDTNCAPLSSISVGGNPYGLAIDSQNNLLVANQGAGTIQKINLANPGLINWYSAPDNYGITIDLNDNIWTGNWYSGAGVWEVPAGATSGSSAIFYPLGNPTTGVTTDTDGNIWASGNAIGYNVTKINAGTGNFIFAQNLNPLTPHGIVGDSSGQVWSVTYENMVRGFDLAGNIVAAAVCANDINGNGICTDDGIFTYTYSDMTGLNRAMLLRAGFRVYEFDSTYNNQHWGELIWEQEDAPPDRTLEVYVRAANATSSFSGMAWTNYTEGNTMPVNGRFLQIKVFLRSRQRNLTPVFYNLQSSCANPKTVSGAGCIDDGSGVCQGCTAACGGGSCTGYRIDNCGYSHTCAIVNSTVCPLDCNLPQNLTCGGPAFSSPDNTSLDPGSFDNNYSINHGWGYTSVYPKPTVWPATVVSGTNIAQAVSSCCYQGLLYCNNGVIYKRYASGTPVSVDRTVICN